MANSISANPAVTTVFDEVYTTASVTGDLNSPSDIVRAGANAKEIKIPKISVTGLGDYDRNSGYTQGAVTLEWETRTMNYDRGTKITVDAMDNEEANGVDPFVKAGSVLQTEQVAPEGDAFTFAKIIERVGTASDVATAGVTYTDAEALLTAIDAVSTGMDEASVPAANRILYITPTLNGLIRKYNNATGSLDRDEIMGKFSKVQEVPQTRFYTAITLNPGTDDTFGYKKATAGKDLNFLVAHTGAVIKFDRHIASRIFQPDELEDLDAYMMKYRKYGLVDVFDNKVAGIAYSHKA